MDEITKLKVEILHYEAQERQKKQLFRQIILPTLIAALVLLAVLVVAVVLAVKDPAGAGYKAGQITLIVVLFFALLIGALLIYALIKAVDGLYKVNRELPNYGKKALGGVAQVEESVRSAADVSVKPMIAVQAFGSKVKQVGKSFKDRLSPEGKENE